MIRPGRLWWLLRRDLKRGWAATRCEYLLLPRILDWRPPVAPGRPAAPAIRTLTGTKDWRLALWMLASWQTASGRAHPIHLHDDGTLPREAETAILSIFPRAQILWRADTDAAMRDRLAGFPLCRAYRESHPLALKIFDMPTLQGDAPFLLFDSDLLFFSKPDAILRWIDAPETGAAHFNEDVAEGSLVSPEEARDRLGIDLWPRVNSGLCLLPPLLVDLDFCERCLRETTLGQGHFWRIEQTLFALCASRHARGGHLPPAYEVSLGKWARPGTVSRHYVGAVRDRFYAEGLPRVARIIGLP